MKQILGAFRRTSFGTVAALFLLTVVGVALPTRDASAAGLLERSLQLSSTRASDLPAVGAGGVAAPAGAPGNGQKVSHTYVFQVPTAGELESLVFQYCSSPFGYLALDAAPVGSCGAVTGFNAEDAPDPVVRVSATNDAAGFAADATPTTYEVNAGSSQYELIVDAPGGTGESPTANQFVQVTFTATDTNFFVNPSTAYADEPSLGTFKTFFAHIETYSSSAAVASDTHVDEGTVTSAIVNTVSINTRVQETLKFSVGSDVDTSDPDAGDPSTTCAPVAGTGSLVMGDAANQSLSAGQEYTARSYFRLATNSSKGAQVLYSGETLTSTAGDEIAAVGDPTPGDGNAAASVAGTEQFGLTLLDNNATDHFEMSDLIREAEYEKSTTNGYAFDTSSFATPVPIAVSPDVVECDTGAVEYVANISNETPAGLYSTRIAYIAVPSY